MVISNRVELDLSAWLTAYSFGHSAKTYLLLQKKQFNTLCLVLKTKNLNLILHTYLRGDFVRPAGGIIFEVLVKTPKC